MLLALHAFWVGLWRAVTGVKCVVVLYVASLLSSAVVTVPIFRLGDDQLARSPAAGALLNRHDPEFDADWMRTNDATFDASRVATVVAAVIYSLTIVFLSGGILAALADRRRPLTFTTFFASCGRYVWPFLRGLVPAAALLGLVFVVNRGATGVVNWFLIDFRERASSAGTMFWLMTTKTMLLLGLLSLAVTLPMQFARIRCVVDDDRRMIANHVAGVRLCFRHAPTMLTFLVLAALPWLAVLALHDRVLRAVDFADEWRPFGGTSIPVSWIYVAFAQLCVFVQQALLVQRSAGLLHIHQELCPPLPARDPELLYAPAPVVDAPRAKSRASEETTAYSWLIVSILALGLGASASDARADEPVPTLPTGPFANEYSIDVTLDPDAATITGREAVTFRNFGTAPVEEIPFHLYPNAWSNTDTQWIKDARKQSEVTKRGEKDGSYLHIRSVTDADGKPMDDRVTFEGTILRIRPRAPVAPGAAVNLVIEFTTKVPVTVRRMGHSADHYDVMQWFPKVCAHRDGRFIDWPFRDPSEFCSDFGKYRVAITLPDDFEIEATGAPVSETRDDSGDRKTVTFAATGVHDFAWIADPHFVRHTTKTKHGTEIVLMNQPFLEPKADLILGAVKTTMENYDEWFFPFPYPRVVVDAVPAGTGGGGMEYPTLFTIGSGTPEALGSIARASVDPSGVTIHEFSHQYWYGMVANNEFEEAWLDEGFTTFMTFKSSEAFFGRRDGGRGLPVLAAEQVYLPALDSGGWLAPFVGFDSSVFTESSTLFGFTTPDLALAGMPSAPFYKRKASYAPFADVAPLRNKSWDVMRVGDQNAYRTIAYSKPCLVLRTLENEVGEDAMRSLLRTWTRRFAFRYPTSDDFVKVADEAFAGRWHDFLVACIDGSDTVDWAVEEARSFEVKPVIGFLPQAKVGEPMKPQFEAPASNAPKSFGATVTVHNRGRLRLATELELRFADGTAERRPIDGARPWTTVEVAPRASKLVAAIVDPDRKIALDLDVTNNGRLAERDRLAALPFAALHQFWVQTFLSVVAWFA